MNEKTVWVLEKKQGPWAIFLKSFFEDVPVRFAAHTEKSEALTVFDKALPAMIFVEPPFLNLALVQKFKVRKQTDPVFRVYLLGEPEHGRKDPFFNAVFPSHPDPSEFKKKWHETLPMPERIRILVIDDEEEIARIIRDYFEDRKAPSFEVVHAANGKEGLEAVARERPDLIILDIKMPGMDGREFYVEFRKRGLEIPVIVFFDSITGEELTEIRKYGNPPVIEKGVTTGSLPVLMRLVKKLVYCNA